MSFGRAALHPLGPISAQAVGHGVNFLSQLLLLHVFGAAVYGDLGLALLTVSTLGFLGELGLPAFLLRLAATDPTWPQVWRVASLHRLLTLGLLGICATLGWSHWKDLTAPGTLLLIAALPGLLLSAVNLAPILYGLNQQRRAALASHLRWATYGAGSLLIALFAPAATAGPLLGLAVSAGWLVQHLWLRRAPELPADLRPRPGTLPTAVRQGAAGLTLLGILALLHGRALPFLLAVQAPALLAPCLLLLQILQGLASLLAQSDRLLLPGMLKAADGPGQLQPLVALVRVIALLTALLLLGLVGGSFLLPGAAAPIAGWMILEWSLAQLGFAGYLGILAQHRESRMLARQIGLTAVCLALHAIAFALPPPTEVLLAGRVLAAAGLAALAILPLAHLPGGVFFRTGLAACVTCLALLWLPLGLAAGLAVLWGLVEIRALYRLAR
jgi:hypothetical protein